MTGSGTNNLSASLLDWIGATLGDTGRQVAMTQPLTTLSLTSARSRLPAGPDVMQDWAQVLKDAQLAVDQGRLAYVNHARQAGLADADIAAGLGVSVEAIDDEVGRLRARVAAVRQPEP